LLAIAALAMIVTGHVRISTIAATAAHAVHPVERIPSVREQAYMDALRKMGLPADSDNAGARN
jgi:hypothetical protein